MEEVIKKTINFPDSRVWESKKDERLRSLFGCSSFIIAQLWSMIYPSIFKDEKQYHCAEQKHLLYALVFLKVYGPNEEVHCAIVDYPHRDTFRKWSWYFIYKICELQDKVIRLDNRFDVYNLDKDIPVDCFMSLDGMDIPCFKPQPFSKGMYLQKHNAQIGRAHV